MHRPNRALSECLLCGRQGEEGGRDQDDCGHGAAGKSACKSACQTPKQRKHVLVDQALADFAHHSILGGCNVRALHSNRRTLDTIAVQV
jgi:hypothetical protein